MNLHSLVSPLIGIVNPPITVQIRRSTGYTRNPDGTRTPTYSDIATVKAQKQPLQYNDLMMTDGLNLQGERCKMYLQGDWDGIVRADQKGGDIITCPDGSTWLVAVQAENWGDQSGWTAVICTRQNQ